MHFQIGNSSIHIFSTLATNQSNTSVASQVPNNKIHAQIPFETSFSVGKGHFLARNGERVFSGDWYNISLQDLQPSFHNTNETNSFVAGSHLMEGEVTIDEGTFENGSCFRICGRLQLSNPETSFFHFKLFQFAHLSITSPSVLSFRFQSKTVDSNLALILKLKTANDVILPSSPVADPRFFQEILKTEARILSSQERELSQKWETKRFLLGEEFVGKYVEEIQVLCYPAGRSSEKRDFTYYLLLGEISLDDHTSTPSHNNNSNPEHRFPEAGSAKTGTEASGVAGDELHVYPIWNADYHKEEDIDVWLTWPAEKISTPAPSSPLSTVPPSDVYVDKIYRGSTYHHSFLAKHLSLNGHEIEVRKNKRIERRVNIKRL